MKHLCLLLLCLPLLLNAQLRLIHPTAIPNGDAEETPVATLNGKLLFTANEAATGTELWITTGEPGTSPTLLGDFEPGVHSSRFAQFMAADGALYFMQTNVQQTHSQCWRTDGTPTGTIRLFSLPHNLQLVGILSDYVLFTNVLAASADESFLLSFSRISGQTDTLAMGFTGTAACVGNLAYFGGNAHGPTELMQTDGTRSGTSLLAALAPEIPAGSNPRLFWTDRGNAFFMATHPDYGTEWWISDGTPAGTRMILDANPGPESSRTEAPRRFNGHYYALHTDGWFSQAVAWDADADTFTPLISNPNLYSYLLWGTGDPSRNLLFLAHDFTTGGAYWETNGTTNGSQEIAGFGKYNWNLFNGIKIISDDASDYITGLNGDGQPQLTYRRGGNFGTMMGDSLPNMYNNGNNSMLLNHALFFGKGLLWRTEGTQASTVVVHDLPAMPIGDGVSGDLSGAAQLDAHTMLFAGRETLQEGFELYRTDGTAAGTRLVKALSPGPGSSSPSNMTLIDGKMYFSAADEAHGAEVWVSDGTEAGTRLVADLIPGPEGSHPQAFCRSGAKMACLVTGAGQSTTDVCIFDPETGLHASTRDLIPGFTRAKSIAAGNDGFFYILEDMNLSNKSNIWKTDGTPEGTINLELSPLYFYPQIIKATNKFLYVFGYDLAVGYSRSQGISMSLTTDIWSKIYNFNSSAFLYNENNILTTEEGMWFVETRPDLPGYTFIMRMNPDGEVVPMYADDSHPIIASAEVPDFQQVNGRVYVNLGSAMLAYDSVAPELIPYTIQGKAVRVNGFRVEEDTIWAQVSGLGLCKIAPVSREMTVACPQTTTIDAVFPLGGSILFSSNIHYGTEWWLQPRNQAPATVLKDLYADSNNSRFSHIFYNPQPGSDSVVFLMDQADKLWSVAVGDSVMRPLARVANTSGHTISNIGDYSISNNTLIFENGAGYSPHQLYSARAGDDSLTLLMQLPGGYDKNLFLRLQHWVCFAFRDTSTGQVALWRTDGTPENTTLLRELGQFTVNRLTDVPPVPAIAHNGREGFFDAGSGRIWRTDGTPEGTWLLADLQLDTLAIVDKVMPLQDRFVVSIFRSDWTEVWVIDSGAVHRDTVSIRVGWPFLSPSFILKDTLYFFSNHYDSGIMESKLWQYNLDLKSSKQVYTFPNFIYLMHFTVLDTCVWVCGEDGPLWRSDGSTAGTKPIYTFQDDNKLQYIYKWLHIGNTLWSYSQFPSNNNAQLVFSNDADTLRWMPNTAVSGGNQPSKSLVRNQLYLNATNGLYSYDIPTLETLPGERAYALPNVRGNQWQYAFQDGYTVAAIHPQGLDLGTVTFRMDDRTNVQEVDGHAFAPRHYAISCAGGPDCPADGTLPRDVRIQLYFMDAELEALNAVTGGSNGMRTVDMVHYNGLVNDCDLSNNPLPGYTDRIASDSMMAYDWWSGFYLEFKTRSLGEFALSDHDVTVAKTPYMLWPNPGRDELNVYTICSEIISVEVFDLTGRRLITVDPVQAKSFTLNTEPLKAGVYHIRVHSRDCGQVTARWVKY